MTNNIVQFQFGFSDVRVVLIGGDPWLVAKDVCDVLGLSNVSKACERLDEDEKDITTSDTLGGNQGVLVISESGFYRLVMTSRKPEVKKFQKWVTSEVLPSIRKTGSYSIAQQPPAESLAQWHKDRVDGKEVRRTLSDAIALFVKYAQAQGSKNADRYFATITHNLVNRYIIEAPIDSKIRDKRNRMDRDQLRHVANIEDVLANIIETRIMAGDDYHEIYQACKDRAAAIAAVLDINPKPLLPESNQRLINQSLARSLKA